MRNIPGLERGDWAGYCKAIRQATDLGTKQLAARAGVARATWWRWESGQQRPESAEVTERFAKGFSLSPDEVMWAAGLAIEDTTVRSDPDPRLHGLDPKDLHGLSLNDKVVLTILALNISKERKKRMLNRRRQILAARERADLEELEEIEYLVDPGTQAG